MTRRHRFVALAVALAGVAWWVWSSPGASGSHEDPQPVATAAANRADTGGLANQIRTGRARTGAIDWQPADDNAGGVVAISGQVIDILDRTGKHGVGNVEVVFRTWEGESSTTTAADGSYRIEVAPGTYRAFVRDDHVLSVGAQDLVRLPGMPAAELADVPDDALLPTVVAAKDVAHLDLSVLHGGVVEGRVADRAGHPIANAVVHARGTNLRPALGTDIAESDASGKFRLRLPPGHFAIEATHEELVGMATRVDVDLGAGDTLTANVTLTAGCVISGRVVGADGQPAGDGAIERRTGDGEHGFGPTGKVRSDGTFRWVTGETAEISLRAWPWKSPHSNEQEFHCTEGARFTTVVFKIPDQQPDISGVLVDANGAPIPLGFVDLAPLDNDAAQQERADQAGRWSVYSMPPGRYRITASSPGFGVVTREVTAPIANVRLQLSGTGRITGNVPAIDNGSLEVTLEMCDDTVSLPHEPRLVSVVAHRFVMDDVPACKLQLMTNAQGEMREVTLTVPVNGEVEATVNDAEPPPEAFDEPEHYENQPDPEQNQLYQNQIQADPWAAPPSAAPPSAAPPANDDDTPKSDTIY